MDRSYPLSVCFLERQPLNGGVLAHGSTSRLREAPKLSLPPSSLAFARPHRETSKERPPEPPKQLPQGLPRLSCSVHKSRVKPTRTAPPLDEVDRKMCAQLVNDEQKDMHN